MDLKYLDRTDDIIKQEMINETDDKVIKAAGTFLNDSYGASSIKLAEVYMELEYLNAKRDPKNLTGKELDMRVEEKAGNQVVRREATYARGTIIVKGENGTVLDKGSLVSINDIHYKTLNKSVIKDKTLETSIECLEAGEIGNAKKNSEVILVNNINSINEIMLKTDITGGYEQESDESLLERYFAYIQMPPTSGNKFHYIHWAKQIEGVGDVKVHPLWKGPNTVKVIITDSNMEAANSNLVRNVQEHIDPEGKGLGEGEAPIGAFCTVVSAKNKNINVEVNLDLIDGFTIEGIKNEVFQNINKYIRKLTFFDSEVSYAKIGAAILLTNGVRDYRDLRINGSKENIILKTEETAVLKDVIINE